MSYTQDPIIFTKSRPKRAADPIFVKQFFGKCFGSSLDPDKLEGEAKLAFDTLADDFRFLLNNIKTAFSHPDFHIDMSYFQNPVELHYSWKHISPMEYFLTMNKAFEQFINMPENEKFKKICQPEQTNNL